MAWVPPADADAAASQASPVKRHDPNAASQVWPTGDGGGYYTKAACVHALNRRALPL